MDASHSFWPQEEFSVSVLELELTLDCTSLGLELLAQVTFSLELLSEKLLCDVVVDKIMMTSLAMVNV